jgi:hypothetical protein
LTSPNSVTTPPDRDQLVSRRRVGAAALAFAVLVLAENVMFTVVGAPGYDSPIDDVLVYYTSNPAAIGIAAGLVALYLPLLLLFVTGLHGIVERRRREAADWSRLAVAAGAATSAIFVLVNVLQIGLALSASGLAESTVAFEIIWQIHAAAFAFVFPLLGATCIGTALAAHTSGLTPAWQRVLGLAAGSVLLAAGLGAFAIAGGSPLIFVGLLGLAGWLVWLIVTGARLIRGTR